MLLSIKDLSIFLELQPVARTHSNRYLRHRIVSDLNFSIKERETFCLVGESGSGKTMTGLAILGILPQKIFCTGEILFRGKNLLSLPPEDLRGIRGKEISMVFQEPMTSLNPVLTIGYQISEVLITHLALTKKQARQRTIELLSLVQVPLPEKRFNDYPHQLSGGLRQRVMIAMAIACNPALLIADEPTTALDVTIQAQILDLLDRLKEEHGLTVLLITHDLGIVRQHSERVGVIYAGSIMELAETETLFREPLHPYTIGLIRSLPDVRGTSLKPIPGSIPSIEEIPSGCRFSPRCEMAIRECTLEEPIMREISHNHFVRCIRV